MWLPAIPTLVIAATTSSSVKIRLFDSRIQQKPDVISGGQYTSAVWYRHLPSPPALHSNHHNARANPVEFRGLGIRMPPLRSIHSPVHASNAASASFPPKRTMPQTRALNNSLGLLPDSGRAENALFFKENCNHN
jgi:hypothetical protein